MMRITTAKKGDATDNELVCLHCSRASCLQSFRTDRLRQGFRLVPRHVLGR